MLQWIFVLLSHRHSCVLPWVRTLSSEFDLSYDSALHRRGEVKPSCAWWEPLGHTASQKGVVSVMGYVMRPH